MTRPKYRLPYDTEADEVARAKTTLSTFEPSITLQAPAQDADLNILAKRYGLDRAQIPPAVFDPRYYGDVGDLDLRTALDRVRDAQERFQALPARLRERFANDPARLWSFVSNPENTEEAVQLGLLARRDAPASPDLPQTQPPTTPNP